ncbi:unnamed protein product [Microthlaspi erraticum]|uniref:RNase H type-1 domain-containing protein n=1 Tax=Microthlaspi erraticum TaxID=1685480 RepID=A0A6D2JRR6_9BRAS|nr:unnamed protein product [Microthlaspi erraticum]
MQIDPQCMRRGMAPETVNHTSFECPPALQVWKLSPIPTAPAHFPTWGLFTNMTQLFWHLPNDDRMWMYPWLIWYIWKARNDKVMANVDCDPNEIIVKAEAESIAWMKAQKRLETVHSHTENPHGNIGVTRHMSGAWGLEGNKVSNGSRMTELEVLIWAMQCMLRNGKLTMVFQTDCSDVVKMVSKPEEWSAFSLLLDEVDRCKRRFSSFSIMHIPRTKNTKADKLAHSARALSTDVYYVNSVSSVWIFELF